EIGHAYVDENQRDFILEQTFEGLARRRRLQEVFADLRQNRFVAEQLGLLVVDQQNVDSFWRFHDCGLSGAATYAGRTGAVRYSRDSQDSRTPPPPRTFPGRP